MIQRDGVSPAQDTVRVATKGDVPAIALLHCTSIDEGFLSSLGERFLSRLYARMVASTHGFVLVAPREGGDSALGPSIAGFIAGSEEIGRLYRDFFWRDGPAVMVSSGVRLVRALPRTLETFRYRGGDHGPDSELPSTGPAGRETELLAMAVDPADRRRGVGAALVDAFVATSRAAGSASARVVVGASNAQAIALYGRAGFHEDGRMELHAGTASLRMRAGLSQARP
jgi:ribosomal-protein-alanine N-acetyltransferase